jgi:hypothetical protein
MLNQCLENTGEGLLHACISSYIYNNPRTDGAERRLCMSWTVFDAMCMREYKPWLNIYFLFCKDIFFCCTAILVVLNFAKKLIKVKKLFFDFNWK